MIAIAPKPAVAYLRRSTDRQEQSLGDQRKEIARWANENRYQLVGEYIDDAISGTSTRDRAGFRKMIDDAKKGEFGAIIVWSSDRFSRGDVTETEHYRHVLREAGVVVLSVTEDYLSREGIDGDVLRTVKQFQNRQFSISLSQNTLRGQISAVQGASDPGRMTPFGYDREIVGPDGSVLYRVRFLAGGDRELRGKQGEVQSLYAKGQTLRKPGKQCTARLVLSDDARVQIVRDIFRWCIEGVGFKAIADRLNRRGIMSPKGRLWQHTTIRMLIANPVYRGDIVWNRRTESKFFAVQSGRADTMKPAARSGRVEQVAQDDWITVEDAVPAIVDRETWDRAQVAAKARSKLAGGKGKSSDRWLLSGVLRCGCCGQPYWGVRKQKSILRRDGTAIVNPYYVCAGRSRCGKSVCPYPSHVPADKLEAHVLTEVQRVVLADQVGVDAAVEAFVASVRAQHGAMDPAPVRREIARIDQQVHAILNGLDPANVSFVNSKLSEMRQRKENLQQELRRHESSGFDEKALRKWASERLQIFSEILAGRRDDKARNAIASYVDEIVIDPKTKTGRLVINAGAAGLLDDVQDAEKTAKTALSHPGKTTQGSPKNANDPSGEGSVAGIERGGPSSSLKIWLCRDECDRCMSLWKPPRPHRMSRVMTAPSEPGLEDTCDGRVLL